MPCGSSRAAVATEALSIVAIGYPTSATVASHIEGGSIRTGLILKPGLLLKHCCQVDDLWVVKDSNPWQLQPAQNRAAKAAESLTFARSNEEYGLEILKLRGIIGCTDVTAILCTPAYLRGVVDLRGEARAIVRPHGM